MKQPRPLRDKVAIVTGAGRGQGRAHAHALARAGAHVVVCDICQPVETVPYELATQEQLERVAEEVREMGREALAIVADVRSQAAMQSVAQQTLAVFDRIDILIANAGVISYGKVWELTEEQWDNVVDVDLKGVWLSCKAVVPAMIAQQAGKIVCTTSIFGLKGGTNLAHYVAAKHGVIGLVRALALELAEHNINVNAIAPTGMDTAIVHNQPTYDLFMGGPGGTAENLMNIMREMNLLPGRDLLDPRFAADATVFLVSEAADHITGHVLPIDAGLLLK